MAVIKDILFRKAQPADVDQAVPLVLLSGPSAFAYVFNNGNVTETDFLKYAFRQQGGEFSFDNHFVLEREQVIIGVGAIFSHQKSKRFILKEVRNIIATYKWRSVGTMIRGLKIEQILLLPKQKEHCIGHVGVLASERGKGLGEYLMKSLMKEGQEATDGKFILDVADDNLVAKSLYGKLNFKVSKFMQSNLSSKFGKVPSHYRMEKHFE